MQTAITRATHAFTATTGRTGNRAAVISMAVRPRINSDRLWLSVATVARLPSEPQRQKRQRKDIRASIAATRLPWLGLARDSESDGTPSAGAMAMVQTKTALSSVTSMRDRQAVSMSPSVAITVCLTGGLTSMPTAIGGRRRTGLYFDPGGRRSESSLGGHPRRAAAGTTFARFRLSSDGGLQSTGLATDGEVEDYSASLSEENQVSVAIELTQQGSEARWCCNHLYPDSYRRYDRTARCQCHPARHRATECRLRSPCRTRREQYAHCHV